MTTTPVAPEAGPVPRLGFLAFSAVCVRPWLWRDAAAVALAMARRHWWRRRPHLPLPDRRYLTWRLQTAYGGDGTGGSAVDRARDLVSFLEFRRALRRDV